MNDVLAAFRDGPAAKHVGAIQEIKTLADQHMASAADTIMSEMLIAVFKAGYEAGRADLIVEMKNEEAANARQG